MKVVILAGGLGTRLQEETAVKPKPMVEIGGHPILWHIMKIYAAYGLREFIIVLGYKGEWIKKYFLNYYYVHQDFSIHIKNGHIETYENKHEDWLVHLVDTGLNTQTGGRIKRLASHIGNETFMLTYGDGVADINIQELLASHRKNGKLATITAVYPPPRFGGIVLKGDLVERFAEKPLFGEGLINGGFFVLEPEILNYIKGDDTPFEGEPLQALVREGQLTAYCHKGFWQCVDVLRDIRLLNNLWESGNPPWKAWK